MIHIFHKKKHTLEYSSIDGKNNFQLLKCTKCGAMFIKGKLNNKNINRKTTEDDMKSINRLMFGDWIEDYDSYMI